MGDRSGDRLEVERFLFWVSSGLLLAAVLSASWLTLEWLLQWAREPEAPSPWLSIAKLWATVAAVALSVWLAHRWRRRS